MKTGVNYVFGAAIVFGLAACGKSTVTGDLENNALLLPPDITFQPEKMREQDALLELIAPVEMQSDLVPLIDLAQLEAEKSENMEKSLEEIASASVLVGSFGVAGIARNQVCVLIATAKGTPEMMQQEYAKSLETQVALGGLTQEEEQKKIGRFNRQVDLWQRNMHKILEECLVNKKDNGREDESFELNTPKYDLI